MIGPMRVTVLSLVLAGVLAAPAAAAPTWQLFGPFPNTASPSPPITSTSDGAGNAAVGWNDSGDPMLARRIAPGPFTAATNPGGLTANDFAAAAIGDRLVLALRTFSSTLERREVLGDGSVTPATLLSSASPGQPAAATLAGGAVVISWVEGGKLMWLARAANGAYGAVNAKQPTNGDSATGKPTIALDGSGAWLLVPITGTNRGGMAALRLGGDGAATGDLDAVISLGADAQTTFVPGNAATNPAGATWFTLWRSRNSCCPNAYANVAYAVRRNPAGGLGALQTLDQGTYTPPVGPRIEPASVAVDPAGTALFTWSVSGQPAQGEPQTGVRTATAAPDAATVGAATQVAAKPAGEFFDARTASVAGGVALSVMGGSPSLVSGMFRTTSDAAFSFAGATSLGPSNFTIETFSTTPSGDAFALLRTGGTGYGRAAAVLDAAGPVLSAPAALSGTAATPVHFDASASDAWSPPVSLSWAFGDGGQATGGAADHTYASGGSFTATVTATDASGNAASRSVPVTVAPAPTPGPGPVTPGPGPVAPAPDRTAPVISALRITPNRFAVRTTGAARTRRGATLSLKLSEAARLKLTVSAVCRRKQGCPKGGTLPRVSKPAGKASIALSGRIGRRALRPGKYRMRVVATDAAGNASRPATATFSIVRR